MDYVKQIEHAFFKMLQYEVTMNIGEKRYRSGKLQNFKVMELYIQIELLVKGKERKVEIPLPFEITELSDSIVFSYQLADMGEYGAELNKKIKKQFGGGKSKLYNNLLTIKRS